MRLASSSSFPFLLRLHCSFVYGFLIDGGSRSIFQTFGSDHTFVAVYMVSSGYFVRELGKGTLKI